VDGIMRTVGEETTNIGVPAPEYIPVKADTGAYDSWAEKD
jgi:hypothetical protein